MKINRTYVAMGLIIAFSLFFELAAHADDTDQATTITFNKPIEIPGKVLPAGTYVFKLAESDSNVVQVFNAERTVLFATLETIATDRQEPSGRTVITLAEQGAGPDALLKWFYPGREIGNEFLYPQQKEKELAHEKRQTIVTDQPTASNSDATGSGN